MGVSLVCVAYNEERRLPDLLQSVEPLVVDKTIAEFVLLDNNSSDDTSNVALTWTARHGLNFTYLFEKRRKGYPDWLYDAALDRAEQPWVLLLDADEVLTPEGVAGLRGDLYEREEVHGWQLPRATLIEAPERAGGWRVFWEWHLRLFRRHSAWYRATGPHTPITPNSRVRVFTVPGIAQPWFLQVRSAGEQLFRDKLRGQYPETPWPEEGRR